MDDLIKSFGRISVGAEKRRYGYFKCPTCGKGWESGNAWCKYKGYINGKMTFEVSKDKCVILVMFSHNHRLAKIKKIFD